MAAPSMWLLLGSLAALPWSSRAVTADEWYESMLDCRDDARELTPESDLTGLETIHVVYGSDKAGFQGVLSSMISVTRNLDSPGDCHIHVVLPGRDMSAAEAMKRCFLADVADLAEKPQVTLHKFRPLDVDMLVMTNNWQSLTGRTDTGDGVSLAKMDLPSYLPGVRRALWLDIDTTVRADVGPLFRMEMQHAIAAAEDHKPTTLNSYYQFMDFREVKSDPIHWAGVEDWQQRAINTGVMLVDLEKWKSSKLTDAVMRYGKGVSWFVLDQLAINLAVGTNYDVLDFRWNLVEASRAEYPTLCTDRAHILHWSRFASKPWHKDFPKKKGMSNYELYKPFKVKTKCDFDAPAPPASEGRHTEL